MNSNDLLDIVGEAKEEHVLDAVNTRNGVQPQKKRLSLNRAILIAAVIAMMLLLVGCTIAYVLSMQDLKIAEEDMVSHYGDNGKLTAPTEVTVDVLSLRGFAGSANQNATLEWYEFVKTYDVSKLPTEGENSLGIPDNYYYVYDCKNWELVDKVDEIAEKYGLKLLSMDTVVQRWQTDIFFDALEIEGMLKPNAPASESAGSGYFYPEGNFKYDFEMKLSGGDDVWPYEIWATMFCSNKDYFDPDVLLLNIDDFEQWNYTTADGTQVLIAVNDHNGILFAETGNHYITVGLNTTMMLSDSNTRRATKEDFQFAADCINFGIQPKTENMVAAIPAMEEADKAYWEEQDASRLNYSQCSNYSEYLLNSTGHASIKGWCTVMDINGDGVDELLQGNSPDSFDRASTMVEGGICDYLMVEKGYPCENSIIETFHTDRNTEYYAFQRVQPGVLYVTDPNVTPELLEFVMYDTETGLWYTGKEWGSNTQISKEEADSIRAKYQRLELNMTPIAEYPMDENGTTLREVAQQNTAKLTEAERLAIYAEIIKNDQEKAYIPSNFYCLMDINGDGIEDLLLGETADYFGDAYTIFNGKSATIHFWSHMNMCEGNILEISGSSTESETHNYYQMDADGRTYIETVSYQYYPEVWMRQDGVDGEQVEITKSEFDAIVASYPHIALDMKPISEFPMQ